MSSSIVDYFYDQGYIDSIDISNYDELFHGVVILLINQKKYEKLVEICKDILSFEPHNPLIVKVLFTLINLFENKSVIKLCKKYLKVNPENERVIRKAINKFIDYNNYCGAINLCKLYLETIPKGNIVFTQKIILASFLNSEENEKIYELVRSVLKFNPKNENFLSMIYWMIEKGRFVIATNLCEILFENNSINLQYIMKIILLLNDIGECQDAWNLCKSIQKVCPNSPDLWMMLGYTFTCMKNYQQALNTYDYALKLVVGSANSKIRAKIWNYIGQTYIKADNLEKAMKACVKSRKLDHSLPESIHNLGYLYFRKGYLDKGIKFIKKALKINKDNYRAWYYLGLIHLDINNYFNAFEACEKCLKINNHFLDGILLYRKLLDNLLIKTVGLILPKLKKFGYRSGYERLDEQIFPPEMLHKNRFIPYSNEFQTFLQETLETQPNIISIYSWLPTCEKCEKILHLYGEIINFKDTTKTLLYHCDVCGWEKKQVNDLKNETIPTINIRVIVNSNSFLPNPQGRQVQFTKLDYENISITYSTFDKILEALISKRESELLQKLNDAVLLWGEDIRDSNKKGSGFTVCESYYI